MAGDAPVGLDAEIKSLAASERDEAARAAWREAIAQRDPEQFVLANDSGTHTSLTRLYGWAPHDQRAVGSALLPQGLQAQWTIEGAMDTEAFERYIEEGLSPTLRPGQVVILDNLSVHTAASIREALEARACDVLFLPSYLPDVTPIEQPFSTIKALLLGGWGARTREALLEAVHLVVAAITPEDAASWFAHVGYSLPAQPS